MTAELIDRIGFWIVGFMGLGFIMAVVWSALHD